MLCIDASFLFNVLVARLHPDHASMWERWLVDGEPMIAPRLMHYEVVNILHRRRQRGMVDEPFVQRSMRFVVALPIRLVDDAMPFDALALAAEFGFPASYDAHYLAVASRHGADLWTSDLRLWEKTQSRLPWVHFAPELPPER